MTQPTESINSVTALESKRTKHRNSEQLNRWFGSVLLAGGLSWLIYVGGDVAHKGTGNISGPEALMATIDVLSLAGGARMLHLASSQGRQADVIDAELLRRQAPPTVAPTDIQLPTQP